MGEKINRIFSKALYPYLYGVAFIVFKSSRYFPSFSIITAVNYLLLFWIFCYFIDSLFKVLFNSAYTGINVVILSISLLHVAGIAKFIGYSYSNIPGHFYILFYVFILVFLLALNIFLVRLPQKNAGTINRMFNTFLLIITFVFIVNGYTLKESKKREIVETYYQLKKNDGKKRDVVWILLDEYASSGSLKQQFSFHNPLDSILKANHFVILNEAKSRFANTLFSLNSIFNNDDSSIPSSYYSAVRLLKNASWVRLLETYDYHIVNLGFFDIGKHKKLSNRSGYPQTYVDQLSSGTIFSMLYLMIKYEPIKCDNFNQEVLKKFSDTVKLQLDYPRFIWTHLSIPHEPFCRDHTGKYLQNQIYDESDSMRTKKSYIEYLQYGNTQIEKLLKRHPELLNKIVIISGDHGPRYPFLQNKNLQKWPFVAIHIPGGCDTVALNRIQYISQLPNYIMNYLSTE